MIKSWDTTFSSEQDQWSGRADSTTLRGGAASHRPPFQFSIEKALPGRYIDFKLISRGNRDVYRCYDSRNKRDCVVKVFPQVFAWQDVRGYFYSLCHLVHPNIVRMLGVECDTADAAYLVMEDVGGGVTAREWLFGDGRGFAPGLDEKRLVLLRDIADALDYVHECGLLHRDVKPSNVLVAKDGHAKLIDFDVSVKGTPQYMAPEIIYAGGKPARESDQWSLAVMAYELICGSVPFTVNSPGYRPGADPLSTMRSTRPTMVYGRKEEFLCALGETVASREMPPISCLSDAENAVLRRALSKAPKDRYESCTAFAEALAVAHRGAEAHAEDIGKAASPPQPTPPRSRRKWLRAVCVAALALAACCGVGLGLMSAHQGRKDERPCKATPEHAVEVSPKADETAQHGQPIARVPDIHENGKGKTYKYETFTLPGGVEMDFVYVAPGKFWRGVEVEGERGSYSDEVGRRQIEITEGFWIGRYEVTQRQWRELVRNNSLLVENIKAEPSFFRSGGQGEEKIAGETSTDDHPVECVSFHDCDRLVKFLSGKDTEYDYFLPTEAQWEYAARGGANVTEVYDFSGSDRISDVAWYGAKTGMTHRVGMKMPNSLGIYDMSGNVYEWCSDWYDENYYKTCVTTDPEGPTSNLFNRVARGGAWSFESRACRTNVRNYFYPASGGSELGLRLRCRRKHLRGSKASVPADGTPGTGDGNAAQAEWAASGTRPPVNTEQITSAPDISSSDPPKPAAAPSSEKPVMMTLPGSTTTYVVQPGDTLSKISKKTGIKIDAIKKANPQIKNGICRVGQKLTIPGKVEIEPLKAVMPPALPQPYTGPTKTYVVKASDTLGSIAHAHKISVAQLKAMNNMKKDVISVGLKLTVPDPAAAAK